MAFRTASRPPGINTGDKILNEKDAIRLQVMLLKADTTIRNMQLTENGVLYGIDYAIIRIPEELAVLKLPEYNLADIFDTPRQAVAAEPTVYRATLSSSIGTVMRFDVGGGETEGREPVWIRQPLFAALKKPAEYWSYDGRNLEAYDNTGLLACIAPVRTAAEMG